VVEDHVQDLQRVAAAVFFGRARREVQHLRHPRILVGGLGRRLRLRGVGLLPQQPGGQPPAERRRRAVVQAPVGPGHGRHLRASRNRRRHGARR